MKKNNFCFCFFTSLLLVIIPFFASGYVSGFGNDSAEVIKLNREAFNNRLTEPSETINKGTKALNLANKLNFKPGIAEANRILGIGYFYLDKPETAIGYYLTALRFFENIHDQLGQAKVSNNIGNLYAENDYERALDYYNNALQNAQKLRDENLIASVYENIGNIYTRKKNFYLALKFYAKSDSLFVKLKNNIGQINCLTNRGVIYYNINQLDTAQYLLLQANKQAKENGLNKQIGTIDLTLVSLFTAKKDFSKADKYLEEGLTFAEIIKNEKLKYDYKFRSYALEYKRKNYKDAFFKLREIYTIDSLKFSNNESTKINLLQEQFSQREKDQENMRIIDQQKYDRKILSASVIMAGLLLVVIVLLVNNVNRKAKTNTRLTELNHKISEQKENLNQINQHLEEIIDERTKDLQMKNKKLADYSLHLSHQIRGPIATLKGLLNLEKDNLIEPEECIKLLNKCVSEIDDNIIDISGMLHEAAKNIDTTSKP